MSQTALDTCKLARSIDLDVTPGTHQQRRASPQTTTRETPSTTSLLTADNNKRGIIGRPLFLLSIDASNSQRDCFMSQTTILEMFADFQATHSSFHDPAS